MCVDLNFICILKKTKHAFIIGSKGIKPEDFLKMDLRNVSDA